MILHMTQRELDRGIEWYRENPDDNLTIEPVDGMHPVLYQLRVRLGNGDECIMIQVDPPVQYLSEADRLRELRRL